MARPQHWTVWEGQLEIPDGNHHLVRKVESSGRWWSLCRRSAEAPGEGPETDDSWFDCVACWEEASRRNIDVRPVRPPPLPELRPHPEPAAWQKVPDQDEALREFNRGVEELAARELRPTRDELADLDSQAQALRGAAMLFRFAGQPMPDHWYPALVDLEAITARLRRDPTAAVGLIRIAWDAARGLARHAKNDSW